jgi:hypothetical protein
VTATRGASTAAGVAASVGAAVPAVRDVRTSVPRGEQGEPVLACSGRQGEPQNKEERNRADGST